jgi:hypothetical protein
MTVAIKNKQPIVVSPAALRRSGFKSGQEIEIKVSGGLITIVPKLRASHDEYTSAQRRAIDRGIAASDKDYKEGRAYGPFQTHGDFIASQHNQAAKLRKPKRKA